MLSSDTLLQNRYKMVKLLGQGGMGSVYLAIDQRLGHKVALKQMFPTQNEIMTRAFEREARILARLNHRCLPKVSDHFPEGGSQYLVMEYIDGPDLGELLERNQSPFAPEQVLNWADNLLDALEYLHHQDPPILHRDIKPHNLKINPRGDLYLLDFGLAKDTVTNLSHPVSTPSVMGFSLSYAPPEQMDRQGTTPETDVYSVCATLYHLLTNQLPADALTRVFSKADSVDDPLIPANKINPRISFELSEALRYGMALRREDRLNATQLRNLLRNLWAAYSIKMTSQSFVTEQSADAPGQAPHKTVDRISIPNLTPITQPQASVTQPEIKTQKNNTQANLSSATTPKEIIPEKLLWPLAIAAASLPILGIILGGIIIAYVNYGSSPEESPTPSPITNVRNEPTVAPTAKNLTVPPSNTANQNINQTVKPVEPKTSSKTEPVKTDPSQTSSTQKTNPPVKKQAPDQKEPPPLKIIPQ